MTRRSSRSLFKAQTSSLPAQPSIRAVAVARFDTAAGAFDNTFGTGGITNLDTLDTDGGASGVVVDIHNQIGIVSTLADVDNSLIVIRLDADGARRHVWR